MRRRSNFPRGLRPQECQSLLWMQVLVCSVLNLFLRICPSVVKVNGREESGEQGVEGPRCCQEEAGEPGGVRAGAPELPCAGSDGSTYDAPSLQGHVGVPMGPSPGTHCPVPGDLCL